MRLTLIALLLAGCGSELADEPGRPIEESALELDATLLFAQEGDAEAQYNLGLMYANGEGVPQDYAEAVKWYFKAAEQGYARAQYGLGFMYTNGNGVPHNYVAAYAWMSVAATNGNEDAKEFLSKAKAELTREQLTAAQRRAAELYKQINANKAK